MTVLDEWVEKAEADYQAAVDLSRRRKQPLPDTVCYHCQQSAEKYLKAYLEAQGVMPPPIHDLRQLLLLCVSIQPALFLLDPDVKLLNPYGVLIRYPGMFATIEDAKDAMKAVRRVRTRMRRELGI